MGRFLATPFSSQYSDTASGASRVGTVIANVSTLTFVAMAMSCESFTSVVGLFAWICAFKFSQYLRRTPVSTERSRRRSRGVAAPRLHGIAASRRGAAATRLRYVRAANVRVELLFGQRVFREAGFQDFS